ncbi:MAG: class I SAM-dependent methyltransferase [Lachnospiraceae bacterium]|nr:class I SAM-dependent methyltransferase [Lachnospiraceae bacterium]
MNDNISAFNTMEYNTKIKQTLPYYDEFYKQVIELVKTFHSGAVRWLDVGCGTGKMGSVAFENVALEKFVFSDCSEKMIKIVKERFDFENTEFVVCDAKELDYVNEFDVITAIQVNHYMNETSRKAALMKYYAALKNNGLFISFENFAPFTDLGKSIYLERWKRYQLEQGKSLEECNKHIERYGKEYFPISLSENIELMKNCGFKIVEILWLSNMQVGIWGIK